MLKVLHSNATSPRVGIVLAVSLCGGIGFINLLPRLRRMLSSSATRRLLSTSYSYGDSSSASENPAPKSTIYTRTGDSGSSSLYNGERRSKHSDVFAALGDTDELNACIGIARELCVNSRNGLDETLAEIQYQLFDVGAAVATPVPSSSETKRAYTQFSPAFTVQLERWIDALDAQLPPLANFVIPSGGLCSTHLNLARAVCRRAERSVVPLVHAGQVDVEVGRYLNRLSDLLFVCTRAAARAEGRTELVWRKAAAQPESSIQQSVDLSTKKKN